MLAAGRDRANPAPAKPYVGAGVNYTRFTKTDILGGAATVDKDSWAGVSKY